MNWPRKKTTVTLPLAPDRYALLQTDWPLSGDEWEQLVVVLMAMKPGLVMPPEAEALDAVFGWLRSLTPVGEGRTGRSS